MNPEDITPEGSHAPVFLDPTPSPPSDTPILAPDDGLLQRALVKVEKAQILTSEELAALA